MGSPLGPVIANIFMVELESVLVPKINDNVKKWRCFVDDTFVYVKRGSIGYVLSVLNSFHDNIKFTYEQINSNRWPFLDVLFIRDHEKINTTVFRKYTHDDLYLHWESFSPISWKRGTLKSLVSRAYMICSNQSLLENELKHLKNAFNKKNGYPLQMINQVKEIVKATINTKNISANQLDILEANNDKLYSVILPYTGPKVNPLSAKFIKWSNTLKQIVGKLPTICLSVFDHFSGLAFKGLITSLNQSIIICNEFFPTM